MLVSCVTNTVLIYCDIYSKSYRTRRGALIWLTGRFAPYVVRNNYVNYLTTCNGGCTVKSYVEYVPLY